MYALFLCVNAPSLHSDTVAVSVDIRRTDVVACRCRLNTECSAQVHLGSPS